ncbi:MAG: apolipoprotein N-acyltransferase [Gammaproteobacteria bacterium]|nr:apolipoprotein N-acyltransferase [Gammaproteobacteria bacterium]
MQHRVAVILALAFLGGAIYPLAFAPFEIWPIALVSLVLLFFTSEQVFERSFFLRLLVPFAFAVGMYAVGTSWVHSSFLAVEGVSNTISTWVTVLFVFAAAGVFTGIIVIFQELWARTPKFVQTGENAYTLEWNPSRALRGYSVLGTALGWVVFEFQNTLVESDIAFPWLQAGYAFIDTWLVGLATVGGVTLVSFFVLVTAMALYRIQRIRFVTMALAALPWLLGIVLLNVPWTRPLEEKEVGLVQSNFSIEEKTNETGSRESWRANTRLSLEVGGVDFVIWPEGALHSMLRQDWINLLHEFAAYVDASVITGILSQTIVADEDPILHNAAVGVSKHAPEYQEYQKTKMAPFGEQIPFDVVLRPIIRWLDLPINRIGPGIGPQSNMELDGVTVGMTICYEIAFPSYVAARSRDADFLVTISEDGWFGNSIGPAQHMQIARMRSVETGRYLARATTKGISAIVDPKGKLIATIPANEQGVVRGTLQTMEGETWFVKYVSGLSAWVWGAVTVLGGGVLSAFGGVLGLLFLRRVFAGESEAVDEVEESELDAEVDELPEEDEDPDDVWS